MRRVLFDGWSLVRAAGTPAALHLAAALRVLSESIQPVLALPEPASGLDWLPKQAEVLIPHVPNTPWGSLIWEQRTLPECASRADAELLFLVGPHAPLASRVPLILSPAGWALQPFGQPATPHPPKGLIHRLAASLGKGGLGGVKAILWPDDLERRPALPNLRAVPPLVHPLFQPVPSPLAEKTLAGYELPQTYFLYHGPSDTPIVQRLLEAWRWAAGPVGLQSPLLILGSPGSHPAPIRTLIQQAGLEDSIRLLSEGDLRAAWHNPANLAALYQGCRALFHPAPISPWGDPVRHALACGKPIVTVDHPWNDALVGPAGYLVQAHNARRMGAALITLYVEEDLAADLGAAAARRARAWMAEVYKKALQPFLT